MKKPCQKSLIESNAESSLRLRRSPTKASLLWMSASVLVFTAVVFLIYSNTLESPFVFDDQPRIKENPDIRINDLNLKKVIQTAFGKESSNARPVSNITFALNYYFHQYNSKGYHLVNIIIHILAGIILFYFLKTTLMISSGRLTYHRASLIAFFAALIWLAHPIQTQSVTYIVQRHNSLAALFYILSFLLYLKGRLSDHTGKMELVWRSRTDLGFGAGQQTKCGHIADYDLFL